MYSLQVKKHNPRNGKEDIVGTTDVVFVRIDEDGAPMPISDRLKVKYNKQKDKNK